jgi:hypothetical protein
LPIGLKNICLYGYQLPLWLRKFAFMANKKLPLWLTKNLPLWLKNLPLWLKNLPLWLKKLPLWLTNTIENNISISISKKLNIIFKNHF